LANVPFKKGDLVSLEMEGGKAKVVQRNLKK
jgi:hypothetical protein